MKLLSYRRDGGLKTGIVSGTDVIEIDSQLMPAELGAVLFQGADVLGAAKHALDGDGPRFPLNEVDYAPAIPRPGKVLCMGLNYFDHAKEGGKDRPDYPWFFMRGPTSLLGHGQPAICPRVSTTFDYEVELAVIIGKTMRHATQETALGAVFGYSAFNDMSLRDYQRKTPQWTMGKNFDNTGAFGPWIVTADELPGGGAGLNIATRLNGVVMQEANTADMMWSVTDAIVLLTECMTLEPGDVIIMGTPAGVGAARTPPVWMRHGDTIEVEIEGIGLLRNPIQDEELAVGRAMP